MSKVLKPCPFCGKEAVIFTYYGNLPIQWGHCGIRFNSVEKWNNRPIEQRLEAELAECKAWINDLQSGMYINCVYCGHRYGPRSEVPASMADVLKEHISICPKHPMSALRARCERLEYVICDSAIPALKKPGDYDLEMVISKLRQALEVPK